MKEIFLIITLILTSIITNAQNAYGNTGTVFKRDDFVTPAHNRQMERELMELMEQSAYEENTETIYPKPSMRNIYSVGALGRYISDDGLTHNGISYNKYYVSLFNSVTEYNSNIYDEMLQLMLTDLDYENPVNRLLIKRHAERDKSVFGFEWDKELRLCMLVDTKILSDDVIDELHSKYKISDENLINGQYAKLPWSDALSYLQISKEFFVGNSDYNRLAKIAMKSAGEVELNISRYLFKNIKPYNLDEKGQVISLKRLSLTPAGVVVAYELRNEMDNKDPIGNAVYIEEIDKAIIQMAYGRDATISKYLANRIQLSQVSMAFDMFGR